MRPIYVAMLMLPVAASAADWELNPRLEAGYLFDDNYRLTQPGTEIDVQGPLVDAALEMRARSPNGEFAFTPRVRGTYFPDEKELDTIDYFATLDWQHRGQRVNTAAVGRVLAAGRGEQRAARRRDADRRRPRQRRHRRFRRGVLQEPAHARFGSARLRIRVVAAARARVRRQFHRRELRQ